VQLETKIETKINVIVSTSSTQVRKEAEKRGTIKTQFCHGAFVKKD
jgi:homoaconitase/3-isopropylmalate dehydratase large subunit